MQRQNPEEASREFQVPYQRPVYSSTPMTVPPSPFQSMQEIGCAIAEGMQASRLPSPQLKVFEGNSLEWPTWKAAFETVIEKRTTTDSERILYLQQYLSGEPKKIVEGYQFVPSPEAYKEAKQKLEKRFGNPSVVADAFRQKLEIWPRIPPKDGKALRDFADFLKTCELAMSSIEDLKTLNTQHENKQLLKILPSWMHPKWGSRVRDYQLKHGEAKFPPFKEFVFFVSTNAEIQCLPVLSSLDSARPQRAEIRVKGKVGFTRNVTSTLATNVQTSRTVVCLWCKADHHLNSCSKFVQKSIKDCVKFIIRKGLCLRCLRRGHMAKDNKCESTTTCTKCAEQHPTCLHEEQEVVKEPQKPDAAATKCTSVCKLDGQQGGEDQCLVVPVWISSVDNPLHERLTYALLDCQSNATFITDSLRADLNIKGVNSHVLLSTMHKENELIKCHKIQGLTVEDFNRNVTIPLPKTYTRESIPCKSSQIPKPEVARQWKHLQRIADEMMPYSHNIRVGLLIGTNCPKAIKPREVIPGSDDDPYGVRTDLGWGIVGRVCKLHPESSTSADKGTTNRTSISKVLSNNEAHKENMMPSVKQLLRLKLK